MCTSVCIHPYVYKQAAFTTANAGLEHEMNELYMSDEKRP
jgi:hypothetical protein